MQDLVFLILILILVYLLVRYQGVTDILNSGSTFLTQQLSILQGKQ